MTTKIIISGATIVEGDSISQLTFTISLSQSLAEKVTLKYVTTNGNATSAQDYTAVTGSLIDFNPGETVKTISVPILNDNLNEPDETFLVSVFKPRNTSLNPLNSDVLAATGIGKITDALPTSSTATLASTIENLTLIGAADISGTGHAASNILTGNSGNNLLDALGGNDTLDGGAGIDTLKGGVGDDTYIVDSNVDTIIEAVGSGTDTVFASFNYTLSTTASNVENLTLTGTATTGIGNNQNNVLSGNAGNNTLEGSDGNDVLIGGAGADALRGGLGDDTYIIDSGDTVVENAGAGNSDTIQANFTYSLATTNNLNIENLVLIGLSNINGTGNSGNNNLTGNGNSNSLTGGAGNDVLDGGSGVDTLTGEAGDDVYILDNPEDEVIEAANGGNDTVQTGFSYILGNDVEKLALIGSDEIQGIGNALVNSIAGNSGNNLIDGGTGGDLMAGGAGNDTYIVENISDVVSESVNYGTDKVESSRNYTLLANLENLTLTGTAVNGSGNTLNNLLIGNNVNNILSGSSGTDTLDGRLGQDVLDGGIGNDSYVVDNIEDVVIETSTALNEIDIVLSSVSYSLGANVENLTLTDIANNEGNGNDLSNTLIGNSGNNTLSGITGNDSLKGGDGHDTLKGGIGHDTLDGGFGDDSLRGGVGDDLYVVDNFKDIVLDDPNAGVDTVQSLVTYFLGSDLENLTLLGTGNTNGYGNSLNNTIIGNVGNNTIDASSGNDSLSGNSGNDILIGGAGNDSLNAGTGTDGLIGGIGDDTYIVEIAEDLINEDVNAGIDSVLSTAATYTLSANVENLTLTIGNINGTGNQLANTIAGSIGANIIDGGAGNDNMTGGAGNDIYVVDSVGDLVNEVPPAITAPTAELDTVFSSINYSLTANVEKLILTGAANLKGTGNTLHNVILGNSGNNTLIGDSGDDYLDGNVGIDSLVGGLDDDSYVIDTVGDIITEAANQGIDLALSSISYTLAANVDNLTLTGIANLDGTGNSLNNLINGNSGNNTLKGDIGDDTMIGGGGNDILVGQGANDVLTGGAGADKFIYNTGTGFSGASIGNDKIADFKSGETDKIILGKTTFGLTSVAGNGFSVASEFATVTTDELAKTSGARIVYSKETGNLFYNANGSVSGAEATLTTLLGIPSLAATDFVIEA